jgi:lysozyme family protein
MSSHTNPHFLAAFRHTLALEGDFSNDPADSGGATRWGVTERVARAHGYQGNMRELPIEFAQQIYAESYWQPLQLDAVALHSPQLASKVFDQGVNCGATTAATWLQRTLNVLNQQGSRWADIPADGQIGRLTLAALDALYRHRGTLAANGCLLRALNALQGNHYISLAQRRAKDEAFVFGWLMNRLE